MSRPQRQDIISRARLSIFHALPWSWLTRGDGQSRRRELHATGAKGRVSWLPRLARKALPFYSEIFSWGWNDAAASATAQRAQGLRGRRPARELHARRRGAVRHPRRGEPS